jgi:hypothetical protein
MEKKLFWDVDNTLVNSKKRFVELYNIEYKQDADWRKVCKYDLSDECPLVENPIEIFNKPQFYNNDLDWEDMYVPEILRMLQLRDGFEIHIVTIGTKENLFFKKQWLKRRLKFINEENYHLLEKTDLGKGEINMINSTLIDDSYINLLTSNSKLKICMHKRTEWNKDCERSGFIRIENSLLLYQYIKKLEEQGFFND